MRIFFQFLLVFTIAGTANADPIKDGDSFGNWWVRCGPQETGPETGCFLFQNVVFKEGGRRVLQVAVGFVGQTPEPIALLSLPLGISLPPGAKMSIDGDKQYQLQIERCEVNGCRAGRKLPPNLIQRFQNGSSLSVEFHDGQRRPIEVPLSLEGFKEGYAALKLVQRGE